MGLEGVLQGDLKRRGDLFNSLELETEVVELVVKLRSRSRVKVRSRSGPRSGPKGPRTKDQRPGPGLNIKFGLPPTHH